MKLRGVGHAAVLTPSGVIEDGAVLWGENGRIQQILPGPLTTAAGNADLLDGQGLLLVPGFIDLQLNGGFGQDFTAAPDTIWSVAAQLPQYGVTSFLPTIITAPAEVYRRAQAALAAPPPGWQGARPLGLHFEGPFLNPAKKGAHNPNYLRPPDPAFIGGWSLETGVRVVTLAPELPGATTIIQMLTDRGVVVSAGHSLATAAEARAGFAAGVRYGTHLFNAMPLLHHREPGLAGALLADDRPIVGLIPDGVHLHPDLVRLAWRALGGERLNLVTDGMAALGMADGRYQLGDFSVQVAAGEARLPDGTLAGSLLTLDTAVRNLMSYTGCGLPEALSSVTAVPARLLALPDLGQVQPGALADLTLLTADGRVKAAIVAGELLYDGRE
jgi:N-acetylglucosamine-6-phosphate deacetylase